MQYQHIWDGAADCICYIELSSASSFFAFGAEELHIQIGIQSFFFQDISRDKPDNNRTQSVGLIQQLKSSTKNPTG